MNDGRTLADLAKEAIQVQDACNLSGVLHSFLAAVLRLRTLFPSEGTAFYNRHPVCVLFAGKCDSLAGPECLCERCVEHFGAAYRACKQMVEEGL